MSTQLNAASNLISSSTSVILVCTEENFPHGVKLRAEAKRKEKNCPGLPLDVCLKPQPLKQKITKIHYNKTNT